MKQVIYKYKVLESGTISLPLRHKILCCDVQNDSPFIWCLVNPDDIPEEQQFLLMTTGYPFNFEGWKYVGTFHQVGGWAVLHLFEWGGEKK